MKNKRILVTGATGFIGQALVPRLINEAEVTLLLLEGFAASDQLPTPLRSLRQRYQVVFADLRDERATVRAVQEAQPDQVIHLAAVGTTNPFIDPQTAIDHNVIGTINLLRACFESGTPIDQFISARTPGEYSAMNPYAASKAAAWSFCAMYARTAAWPITGAMIFQAYGLGQPPNTLIPAALQAALAGKDFPMTDGLQEKDWIAIDDIVDGIIRLQNATLPPGKTVELGTGVPTPVRDVVRMIYEKVGGPGKPLWGALPRRPGEETRQIANIDNLYNTLNWAPSITLSYGLSALVEHARRQA